MVVGFPLDIARYAIICQVVAAATGFNPGRVFMPSSNSHIYENCWQHAEEMITRTPHPECFVQLPVSILNIDDLKLEDFDLYDYCNPHPAIKLPVN